jgi:Bardet-Biedl syndrome 7 protein
MHKEKAYVSQGTTVKGIKKKGGKEFYRLETGLTEDISMMHAELPDFWCSGEYVLHHFRENQKIGTFMAPDRINAIVSQNNVVSNGYDCIVGCQDRLIRVIKDLKVECEVVVEGPVTALSRYPNKLPPTDTVKSFMYGTEKGSAACITIKANSIKKNWQLQKGRHSITVLNSVDFTRDGVEDLLVGRDNGSIEIWSFDVERPTLVFERNVNESITSIESGFLFAHDNEDIVVSTYSGKVLGYCSDQAGAIQSMNEQDDVASQAVGKLVSKLSNVAAVDSTKVIGISNEHRITGIRKEIETLEEKVLLTKAKYSKVSEDMFAVYAKYAVQQKLVLDSENAYYRLSVETDINIETVGVQSDVAIDLVDAETPSVIISNNKIDGSGGQVGTLSASSKFLATFRCTELTKRLEILIRTVEGQYGTVEAFILPKLSPRISKVVSFTIKPLSMHERIHEIPTNLNRNMNKLSITGTFSQSEMHAWVSRTVEGIPDKILDEECTYFFRSTFQNTYLICKIKKGDASFETDNVSTLGILEEVITKEATDRKTRVKVSFEIDQQSYASTLTLLWPKLEYQLQMSEKVKLIEALKELQMHEESTDYFSEEYQDVLKNAESLQTQFKQQPRRIGFLFDIVIKLYADKLKFKRQNATAKLDALKKLLTGGKCTLEALINYFNMD